MKFLLLIGFFTFLNTYAADWPNFRGPAYDGKYTEEGLILDFSKSKPKSVWKKSVKTGFSSIVTSNGKVYTMGHAAGKDTVFCLNDENGEVIWEKSYKAELQPNLYEGGPNSTPTVHEGLLYTLGKHGQFYCWDANSGKEKWSVDISKRFSYKAPDWGFSSSPFISGDLVIINAGESGIAFDRKSGKLAWESKKDKGSYATPVPYKGDLLLFTSKKLIALKAADGKKLWELDWKTSYDINSADPIVTGDKIFISSGYGKGAGLVSVEGAQAKFDWTKKSMRNHFNSCVVVDGYAYGIDGNTNDRNAALKCISLKDGKEMWSEALGFGSVTLANDKLLVLREKGMLVSVDVNPDAYKENGRVQILGGKCWTSPIVSNGHLYARNARGDIVKLKLK